MRVRQVLLACVCSELQMHDFNRILGHPALQSKPFLLLHRHYPTQEQAYQRNLLALGPANYQFIQPNMLGMQFSTRSCVPAVLMARFGSSAANLAALNEMVNIANRQNGYSLQQAQNYLANNGIVPGGNMQYVAAGSLTIQALPRQGKSRSIYCIRRERNRRTSCRRRPGLGSNRRRSRRSFPNSGSAIGRILDFGPSFAISYHSNRELKLQASLRFVLEMPFLSINGGVMKFGWLDCFPLSVQQVVNNRELDETHVAVHGVFFKGKGCRMEECFLLPKEGPFDGGTIPIPEPLNRSESLLIEDPNLGKLGSSGAAGEALLETRLHYGRSNSAPSGNGTPIPDW